MNMARRIPSVVALQKLAVHLLLASMNITIPATAAAAAAGRRPVVRILASRAAAYGRKTSVDRMTHSWAPEGSARESFRKDWGQEERESYAHPQPRRYRIPAPRFCDMTVADKAEEFVAVHR